MDAIAFGQLVKATRKGAKLTQQEFSNKVGISRNYLSQIELGYSNARNLSYRVKKKICWELQIPMPGQKQEALMIFDPTNRTTKPYPSHARQFRTARPKAAWLFDPWIGSQRDAEDVAEDPFGKQIDHR